MRDELERLADRLADIHISDHRPGLWAKMADVAEKLRALAECLPTDPQAYTPTRCRECGEPTMHVGTLCYACAHKTAKEEEVMQIEPGNSGYTPPVAPPPSDVGGGGQVPLPHPDCGSISIGRRVFKLGHSDEAMLIFATARVAAETAALRAKLAEATDWASHLERAASKRCDWPDCNCKQSIDTKLVHCERLPIRILEDSAGTSPIDDLRAEAERLRKDADNLRAILRQVYGMADKGSESPGAAYRWCERIDEVICLGRPLSEYVDWEADLPPAIDAAILADREEKEEGLGGLVGAELAGGES
jgi:hypothetical protein